MDPTTLRVMSGAAQAPPVGITFSASPTNPAGTTATTLSWNVLNAVSVSIDQGVGAVANTGASSQTNTYSAIVTYTLTATGFDGLITQASVTVYWGEPACIWALYGNPQWC